MNRTAAILFCCLLAAAVVRAQNLIPAVSRSGQFVIFGVDPALHRPFAPELETNNPLIRLEPALLAVSCERIKQALLGTLNAPDQWRGKICVGLHPFQSTAENFVLTSEHYSDGWRYRLALPDAVEPQRLVRLVTQLLLLEMANRTAGEQSAQLPPWLAEGMPPLLLAGSDIDLVLQAAPPANGNNLSSRVEIRTVRPTDLLKQSCERLRQHAPLTIAQLGQPLENLNDDAGQIFQASAFYFLHELLQLPNGGGCLYAALPELAWDPDGRIALLRGFHSKFKRELDLEKWWALQTVYVAGRTPDKTWSRVESLVKLNDLLQCPLEVQITTNEPALQTAVPMQAFIKGWPPERQKEVLREKITALSALQLRTPPELSGLVQDYRRVLEDYSHNLGGGMNENARTLLLQGRHTAIQPEDLATATAPDRDRIKDVLLQLDVLDQRCAEWRGVVESSP